jgi:hypothetical protein
MNTILFWCICSVRILLDESVPVQVRMALEGHSVPTVVEMGWRGTSNGELLDRAEAKASNCSSSPIGTFAISRTRAKRRIAILELWTNHRPTLEQYFVRIRDGVQSATAWQYVVLEQEDK